MTSVLEFLKRKSFLLICVATCFSVIGSQWVPRLQSTEQDEIATVEHNQATVGDLIPPAYDSHPDSSPEPGSPGSFRLIASDTLTSDPFRLPNQPVLLGSETTELELAPATLENSLSSDAQEPPADSLTAMATPNPHVVSLDQPGSSLVLESATDVESNPSLESNESTLLDLNNVEPAMVENDLVEAASETTSVLENLVETPALLADVNDTNSFELVSTHEQDSVEVDQPINVYEGELLLPQASAGLAPYERSIMPSSTNCPVKTPLQGQPFAIIKNTSDPQANFEFSPLPQFSRKGAAKFGASADSGYRPFAVGNPSLNRSLKPLGNRRTNRNSQTYSGGDFVLSATESYPKQSINPEYSQINQGQQPQAQQPIQRGHHSSMIEENSAAPINPVQPSLTQPELAQLSYRPNAAQLANGFTSPANKWVFKTAAGQQKTGMPAPTCSAGTNSSYSNARGSRGGTFLIRLRSLLSRCLQLLKPNHARG